MSLAFAEHLARYSIDTGSDPLESIRHPVEQRFDQAHHDLLAVGDRHRIGLLRAGNEIGESLRFRVANRDERIALEHERNGRVDRLVALEQRRSRQRHELRAVLLIEPCGDFDFLHLLARRQRDCEKLFDVAVVLRRRIIEVDPDGRLSELSLCE